MIEKERHAGCVCLHGVLYKVERNRFNAHSQS